MQITAVDPSQLQEMLDAIADLERVAQQIDPEGEVERKIRFLPVGKTTSYASFIRKVIEDHGRRFQEAFDKFRMLLSIAQDEIQRVTKHAFHRTQARSTSTGKQSAKKSVSTSGTGGTGGDGGGDGDGPHRTRPKQKKRPSPNRNICSERSPIVLPGEVANTSPPSRPSLPPSLTQGVAPPLLIYCTFVIALIAMGERDMAQYVLGAMAIPGLLGRDKKPPSDKD